MCGRSRSGGHITESLWVIKSLGFHAGYRAGNRTQRGSGRKQGDQLTGPTMAQARHAGGTMMVAAECREIVQFWKHTYTLLSWKFPKKSRVSVINRVHPHTVHHQPQHQLAPFTPYFIHCPPPVSPLRSGPQMWPSDSKQHPALEIPVTSLPLPTPHPPPAWLNQKLRAGGSEPVLECVLSAILRKPRLHIIPSPNISVTISKR